MYSDANAAEQDWKRSLAKAKRDAGDVAPGPGHYELPNCFEKASRSGSRAQSRQSSIRTARHSSLGRCGSVLVTSDNPTLRQQQHHPLSPEEAALARQQYVSSQISVVQSRIASLTSELATRDLQIADCRNKLKTAMV